MSLPRFLRCIDFCRSILRSSSLRRDIFVEDYAAVGLDLSLARAAHAYTAALTLKVCPHAGEPREQVLVLGQLHLCLGIGCARSLGKDIEDEASAVEDLDLQLPLYVGYLLRRQIIVEDSHRDIIVFDIGAYLPQACPSPRRCGDWGRPPFG